ncbi:MAG: TIGR03013 family XrtA/PEP-CTERM system glycosyltransferase [Vicinamibacterales bacterium]
MAKGLIQEVTWRSAVLLLLEMCLIVAAIATAAYIRLGPEAALELMGQQSGLLKILLITYVCQLCLYYCDLYDDMHITQDRRELLIRMFQALGGTSIILSLLYFVFPNLMLGRGVVVIAALLIAVVVSSWRVVFSWLSWRVGPRERLLLVGTSVAGVALARELHQRQDLGVEIVGFIDADPDRVGERIFNPGIIGTVDDIPSIVRTKAIDRVVVSLTDARGKLPMWKLLEMRTAGVTFHHLASVYEHYTGKIAVENLRPSWLIFSSGFRKSAWQEAVKRLIDVGVSMIGLVIVSPLLVFLAAAVRLTSPGPVLYRQERVGLHGRVFTVFKVRSMHADAEAATGAVWAQRGDSRITALGRFMRRTRLDELPQFWNVLRGDMSLVGPRPERPEFVKDLEHQIPFYGQRHVVKPGLTGWAQVRYTYGASVEDAMEKLQYDLYYIKNFTISLDLFILFETLKTVLLRRGV